MNTSINIIITVAKDSQSIVGRPKIILRLAAIMPKSAAIFKVLAKIRRMTEK